LAPSTQPQVLAVQVKSATTEPQSPRTLQQVPPPFEVYVHDDCTHETFWQPLPAAQSFPVTQQPPVMLPVEVLKHVPVTMLQLSLVHALPSLQSAALAQQLATRAVWQLWLTQLTVMHAPAGVAQSGSPLHDESAWPSTPTLVGALLALQAASNRAGSDNLRNIRRPS
jgi:hypothetical protein